MPYILKSDPVLGCILVRWNGTFSSEEGAAYYREVMGYESYRNGANVFHDVRLVNVDVPSPEIHKVAMGGPGNQGTSIARKVAILSSSNLGFGMMRMLGSMREQPGLTVNVFRDLEEAKAWLGFPMDIGDPFEDMVSE